MAGNFQLWISHDLSERIRRHGAETFPHECCGALLGRDSTAVDSGNSQESGTPREVLDLFPMVNRRDDSPRNRFAVTANDVRDAEKAARQHGLEVVAGIILIPIILHGPASLTANMPGRGTAT